MTSRHHRAPNLITSYTAMYVPLCWLKLVCGVCVFVCVYRSTTLIYCTQSIVNIIISVASFSFCPVCLIWSPGLLWKLRSSLRVSEGGRHKASSCWLHTTSYKPKTQTTYRVQILSTSLALADQCWPVFIRNVWICGLLIQEICQNREFQRSFLNGNGFCRINFEL